MFEIPTILTAEELLDKGFRRAQKVQVTDPDFRFRMQKLNKSKVDSLASVIDSTLEKYIKAFPSFNNLSPFYMALIDILEPIDDIKRMLGRLEGVRREVKRIQTKTIRQITRTAKPQYMDLKRNEAFGRIASLIRDLDADLKHLNIVREKFKTLPSISTKHPTAVVAGYPSVGKSQLVKMLSTADPAVASYPFTTKDLTVGYFNHRRTRYQVVDTPGLLDRPFEKRNAIEKQAILAVNLLSNTCVFLIDPTGHCGFTMEPQIDLLMKTVETIPQMDILLVINKSDLDLPQGITLDPIDLAVKDLGERCLGVYSISADSGEGLEDLRQAIVDALILHEEKPWENFKDT
jgi:nucleolar GTP-binding protein